MVRREGFSGGRSALWLSRGPDGQSTPRPRRRGDSRAEEAAAKETPGHTDQLLVSVGVGGRTFRGWLAMTKAPAGVAIELERGKA